MSREGLEVPLLGLLNKLDPEEVQLQAFFEPDQARVLGRSTVASLLQEVVEHGDPTDPVERYWMARMLVDLRRRGPKRGPGREMLWELGRRLLQPYEDRGEGSTDLEALGLALDRLQERERLSADALELLGRAFHGVLEISGDVEHEQVLLSGRAAELATLLIELSTGGSLHCALQLHKVNVGGKPKEVIRVEVDTCTNRSFADCKRSIDPTHWPKANPFFQSVTVVGTPTKLGTDWCGVIKEKVGPGINGKVYETDLAVTYVERPGMAVTAFDLAPHRTDPGTVTVDRGFLSCTDEGVHRRIRTLKVYRIEDLKMPASWICPLWASQLALAAWWGAS
jgi:hypothetical protein